MSALQAFYIEGNIIDVQFLNIWCPLPRIRGCRSLWLVVHDLGYRESAATEAHLIALGYHRITTELPLNYKNDYLH